MAQLTSVLSIYRQKNNFERAITLLFTMNRRVLILELILMLTSMLILMNAGTLDRIAVYIMAMSIGSAHTAIDECEAYSFIG